MKDARILQADNLATSYFENKGTHFASKELPIQVQFSPVHAIASVDVDQDGDKDLIIGGNETYARVRIGKTDANRGFVFLNDGTGGFTFLPQDQCGLNADGDVRDFEIISSGNQINLLLSETGKQIKSYSIVK